MEKGKKLLCVVLGLLFTLATFQVLAQVNNFADDTIGQMSDSVAKAEMKPSSDNDLSNVGSIVFGQEKYVFKGKAIKPKVAVYANDKKLKKNKEYTLSLENNNAIGKAKAIATGSGDYTGQIEAEFSIIPPPVKIKKIVDFKSGFEVQWKASKDAEGYEIEYSTDSSFNNAKKTKVTDGQATSTKIKNLEANKTYFARLRSYKVISDKFFYSNWSKAKKYLVAPYEKEDDPGDDGDDDGGEELEEYNYLIIDLDTYEISYLDEEPEEGWTDEYKTKKMVFRLIQPGTFIMGSPNDELGRKDDEIYHEVTLTKPYYLGVFEVTQKQYQLITGDTPSVNQGAARPVENVSYEEIRGEDFGYDWPYHSEVDDNSFMGILRSKVNLNFDLPTEAQWEYACRAGTITPLNDGNYLTNQYEDGHLNKLGRYSENRFDYNTHVIVGSYLPNAWGLYDMHGNVWEWCLDWYDDDLGNDSAMDPGGAEKNNYDYRVVRGGSWNSSAYVCRSAFRGYDENSCNSGALGFRVAISDYVFNRGREESFYYQLDSDTKNSLPIFKTKVYIILEDGTEYLLEDIGILDDGGTAIGRGYHKIYWHLKDKAFLRRIDNCTFRVEYEEVTEQAKYLVFNLKTNNTRVSKTGPNLSDDKCRTEEIWLRRIEPGNFSMGSPEDELGRKDDETKHKVTLTEPYYIGVFEITENQFETVCGYSPSWNGDLNPVVNVSYNTIRGSYYGKNWPNYDWVDDNSFLGKLHSKLHFEFDLPTEAQWEYACRAGASTALNNGKNLSNSEQCSEMDEVGRYYFGKGGYGRTTVGSYLPNNKGLYDMHGNVAEWILDWYKSYDSQAPMTNPVGAQEGTLRVIRGGGWNNYAKDCRSAARQAMDPKLSRSDIGFRIVYDSKSYPYYDEEKLKPRTFEYEIDLETQNTFPVIKPIFYAKFKDGTTCLLENMGRLEGDGACGIVTEVGKHKITWYPDAVYDDFEFKFKYENHSAKAKYLVLDLQTYKMRSSEVGPDLSNDKCRTDELWLRRIEPGAFIMGSPSDEIGRADDETQHKTTLVKAYYVGVFETTQKQYEFIRGNNPSYYNGDTRPVERVSYYELRGSGWPTNHYEVGKTSFFGILRSKTGIVFDLPTEAQWEFACRAGTTKALNNGKNLSNSKQCSEMDEVGRYYYDTNDGKGNYRQHTIVGSYLPNSKGLYDMHGNVSEWCLDWYASYDECAIEPKGASNGNYRVLRGGNWYESDGACRCRSASRSRYSPGSASYENGFRIALLPSMSFIPDDKIKKDFEYEIELETQNTFPVIKPLLYAKFKDGTTRLLEEMGTLVGDGACGILIGGGKYKVTWYADAIYDDFELKVKYENHSAKAKYLVLDLQTYKMRASEEGPDLSNDKCRTRELWLRRIEPGTFSMGSPENELGRQEFEPKHKVTLTKAYYIGVFETTQKQYELITGKNPSSYIGGARPVENIAYNMLRGSSKGTKWPANYEVDENSFFGKIRAKTNLTFDLPTEAQWEYACRAGTATALNSGKDLTNKEQCPEMREVGRYNYNRDDGKGGHSKHTAVGSYLPNSKGLYDMHGNVFEWCLDWDPSNYSSDSVTDPRGAKSGYRRVFRGGSWLSDADGCRSAAHFDGDPNESFYTFGFRLVVVPEKVK